MTAPRGNPFVFVVGCPRSGTTLLQRMLDCHPQLAVANDSNFIHKAMKAALPDAQTWIKQRMNPPLLPELAEFVRTYKRFVRLGLPDADVRDAAARCRTWSEYVTALYDLLARVRGKPFAGEKTPDYVRRMPLLHDLFPATPFVHIIRDARDVALSLREWAQGERGPAKFEIWQTEPMATCALWWCWLVATGRRDGAALGARHYFEVRYERLVAEPEATLRQVVAFLELPYDDAMLRYHQGRAGYEPGASAKSAWLPPTVGLRDWCTQMHARDLQVVEAIAADLLDELGYQRSTAPDREVIEAVTRCRRWWHSSSRDAHE